MLLRQHTRSCSRDARPRRSPRRALPQVGQGTVAYGKSPLTPMACLLTRTCVRIYETKEAEASANTVEAMGIEAKAKETDESQKCKIKKQLLQIAGVLALGS